MPLKCLHCDETRPSMSAMHWHLRNEHGLTADEAYSDADNYVAFSDRDLLSDDERQTRWNKDRATYGLSDSERTERLKTYKRDPDGDLF